MRGNNTNDFIRKKDEARKKYAERQIAKWAMWSFNCTGKISYRELLEVIEKYKP